MSAKLTKSQLVAALAEKAGLDKGQVNAVFDALITVVKEQLSPEGPGEITILNLLKLKVKETKAKEAGMRPDPVSKELRMQRAKPASRKVKATPMKGLKELIEGPKDA
ncbi:MAG: HU family DNA-binding protein [Polyangiaceae bacterium]